jgi:anti-anti-sigma factor
MIPPTYPHRLHSEQVGNVTVVSFTERELLDELMIQKLGEQLLSLAAGVERRSLLVDMGGVERFSTTMLCKLIALHKKLKNAGGRLILCRIDPRIYEIFRIFNFRRLIPIYQEEPEALQHC